jgi:hypothetical protein
MLSYFYIRPEDEGGGLSASPPAGDDRILLITTNLHGALSGLRDRILGRVL